MGAARAGKGKACFAGGLGGLGDRNVGENAAKSSNPDDFDPCLFNKPCFEERLVAILNELGCCVMDGEAEWKSAKSSSNGSPVVAGLFT